jgi:hypothetical protein
MSRLSLSRAWEETRAVLVRDGKLFASVALALIVLPETIAGVMAPTATGQTSAATLIPLAVTILIGLIAQIALNRLAIGPSTTVGAAVGRGFARMPALLGAFVLLMVGIFIILIPIVVILSAFGLISAGDVGNEASASLLVVIVLVAALCYSIFQLTIPVAAAETGGSIHLLSRSWHLGRHAYLTLLGFVLLVFLCLIVVLLAAQVAFGSMAVALLGSPAPMSLSALVIALVLALLQAILTVIFAVMLARIYVQLAAGGTQASVPKSGT